MPKEVEDFGAVIDALKRAGLPIGALEAQYGYSPGAFSKMRKRADASAKEQGNYRKLPENWRALLPEKVRACFPAMRAKLERDIAEIEHIAAGASR